MMQKEKAKGFGSCRIRRPSVFHGPPSPFRPSGGTLQLEGIVVAIRCKGGDENLETDHHTFYPEHSSWIFVCRFVEICP